MCFKFNRIGYMIHKWASLVYHLMGTCFTFVYLHIICCIVVFDIQFTFVYLHSLNVPFDISKLAGTLLCALAGELHAVFLSTTGVCHTYSKPWSLKSYDHAMIVRWNVATVDWFKVYSDNKQRFNWFVSAWKAQSDLIS